MLHTDGATDARDRAGDLFGFDRLLRVVQECGRNSAEEMAAGINDAVGAFAEGAPPEDDLTLLVVRYLGKT